MPGRSMLENSGEVAHLSFTYEKVNEIYSL